MSDSLQHLVDRAVFFSTEVQQYFGRLVAGAEFDIDFSAAPSLRFTGEQTLELRPHLIGTDVRRQREANWHWGWTNDSGFPAPVVELSQRVRDYGASHGITELTAEELHIDAEALPIRLTLAAKAVTGAWAHYPAPAGGGTTAWILLDDPQLALGEPQLKAAVKAIASGITDHVVADHRAALESYFQLRGLRSAELEGGGIRLLCADGSADITFDDAGRIATCQAAQPLEGEAQEQYTAAEAPAGTAVFGTVDVAPVEQIAQPAAPAPASAPEREPAPEPTPAPRPEPTPAAEPAVPQPVAEQTPAPAAEQSPATEPAPEPVPAAEVPTTDEKPSADRQPAAQEQPAAEQAEQTAEEKDDKQEKKGFFKRLFGR